MSRPARFAGFTLFELLIAIAIAGVLAAVAVPNMRVFMLNNRLTGAANDLLRSVQVARAEAIKRQQIVAVCASDNTDAAEPSCSGGPFAGWIVFQDTNNSWQRETGEPVVSRQTAPASLTIVQDLDSIMSYVPTGFTNKTPGQNPVRHIVLCDERGNTPRGDTESTARALFISESGRTRVSRLRFDVDVALGQIAGGTCP